MMLDNIKIRKLENGYTVKYHVEFEDGIEAVVLGAPKGYSKEVFVADKKALGLLVDKLITTHIKEEAA